MDKFDTDNNAILMAIIDAESRHPKPGDGPTHLFPTWDKPLVKVNSMYGQAYDYARPYSLIGWWDGEGSHHMEWIAT